ncbi:hypothetical protein RJY99_004721 [Vibrio vulnificus]|nr:hypothetical protein [Vibrio vulnificus]ELC9583718.1 hypothetical protein [Vibrio vulnificus]
MTSIVKATNISAFPNLIKSNGSVMKKATGDFIVALRDIHFTPEWNIRKINRDQVAAIKSAIINGELVDPLELEMVLIDGIPMFLVVDGHHTYVAINELVSEGRHDGYHKATIFKGSEFDKVVRAFNCSQSLPLGPLDTARAFQRMLDETKDDGSKVTKSDISKRTGKPLAFISNSLFLLKADEETQRLIDEGKIKASRVGRIMREHGVENVALYVKAELSMVDAAKEQKLISDTAPQLKDSVVIEDAEYSVVSGGTTEQQPDNPPAQLIATKNALKLKSLSAGRISSMTELFRLLAKRGLDETGSITLNEIERAEFEALAIDIAKVDNHNALVKEKLSSLQC